MHTNKVFVSFPDASSDAFCVLLLFHDLIHTPGRRRNSCGAQTVKQNEKYLDFVGMRVLGGQSEGGGVFGDVFFRSCFVS